MKKKETIIKSMKNIMIILKWLTLIIYLGTVVMAVYNTFQWKGEWRYLRLNMQSLPWIMIVFVVIPVLVLMFLFYQSKKRWQLVLQGLLQIVFLCFLPALILVFVGFAPSVVWSSHTVKLENYRVFDENVREHLNASNWDIIPSDLPKDIEESTYTYDYYVAMDSLVVIEASWKYLDDESYEQEKERVLQKNFVETFTDQGYTVCKMTMPGSNSDAEFGYNDDTKCVFYKIRQVW
ncbi:MAG: hypothetical protein K6D96_04770 [Acetatifactor sp.]|nr:hypothetical protein [Acetatifactor sp.]